MMKTVVLASVCCVALFLLVSAACVKGHADEQQVAAAPQRSFIGRFQMVVSQGNPIRIFDTATGKYVQQEQISPSITAWAEIDPIGSKTTPEKVEEMKIRERERRAEEREAARRRALKGPDEQ